MAFLCCHLSAQCQLITWAAASGNSGQALATDALGNVYKGGFAANSVLGWSIEKYSSSGTLLWTVHDGGTPVGGVGVYDIAVAPNGDIYVTTSLRPGSHIGQDSIIVTGIADYALIKYNNQGQLQWYKLLTSGNDNEAFTSLSITSTGNVVAQGYYNNSFTLGGQTLTNPGYHIFWGVYTPNGTQVSLNHYTAATAIAWSGAMDGADNLYVTAISFTTGLKTLYKFNLAGTVLWQWEAGTAPGELTDLTLDNTGAIYLTGEFSGTAIFNGVSYTSAGSTNADAFVVKLHSDGSFGWLRQFGGTNIDDGMGVDVDDDCNVYFTGYYNTNSSFEGVALASMGGGHDIFFASVDSAGTFRWATNGGGAQNDMGYEMAYDAFNDRMIAAGYLGSGVGSTFGGYSFLGGNNGYLVSFSEGACQIKGQVYRDNNNNGMNDGGDMDFPNIMVRIEPGNQWTNSPYQNEYNAYTGIGTFTVDVPNVPAYHVQTGPTTHTATFTAFGQVDSGNDFGLHALANMNDLRITLTSGNNTCRPFQTEVFYLSYSNVGTTFISDATVQFTFDSLFYSTSFPLSPTVNSPGLLSWDLPTIYPGDNGMITVYMDVPALTIGSLLDFSAQITLGATDETPAENVSEMQCTVVNSYDPNDKSVFPAGPVTSAQVGAGLELSYLIRFQNTGNDTAYFIRLVDTLSANLDIYSFEWLGQSHPAQWSINEDRVLIVDFENIFLVDSFTNEPGSHGFFRYRLKALTTLVQGDQIDNTAYIYFDFNDPIVTNTVETVVSDPVSVHTTSAAQQLMVFPIPASDRLSFKWRSDGPHSAQGTLMDAFGRTCASFDLTTKITTLDIAALSSGMYFFRVIENGVLVETGKVIVGR